jgi:hypothetical protein
VGQVSPQMAQAREAMWQAREHEFGSLPILQVGGMHDDLEQQTPGIHQEAPRASIHLLAAVVAMRAPLFDRLDRLTAG